MSSHESLLPEIVDLALKAGREIMDVYAQDFEEIKKKDGSPVTVADHRAEAIILEGLSALTPGVPIVAEEEVAAGRTPAIGRLFYLVDPLDGTRDFLERENGEFTVNIALIEEGAPVLGVVYAPAKGDLFYGAGAQAWRQRCDVALAAPIGPRLPLRANVGAAGALRLITSRRATSAMFKRFGARIGPHQHDHASSSIKFCLIAAGEADLYPRFGQVSEWDAAAGDAVLRGAGGKVCRGDGSLFLYGQRAPDFSVDGLIAFGGPVTEEIVLKALKEARSSLKDGESAKP